MLPGPWAVHARVGWRVMFEGVVSGGLPSRSQRSRPAVVLDAPFVRLDPVEWSERPFDDLLAMARTEIQTLAHAAMHTGNGAKAPLGSLVPPNAAVLWLSASPSALAAALACTAPFIPVARVDDESFVTRALSAAGSTVAPILVERRIGRRTPAAPTAPARVLLDLVDAVVVAARHGLRVVQYPMAGAEYLGLDRRASDGVVSPAKVVRDISAMLALLGIPVAIENPCVDMTGEEILRAIISYDAASLIAGTTSCSMPESRAACHCGACLSCFERRGAVLRLGLEAHDPAVGYARDPFTGARDSTTGGLAATLLGLDPGQVPDRDAVLVWSSAASLLPGDFADNLDRVVRLWQRRASELTRTLDLGVAVHAQALRRGELPRSCLLVDLVLAAYRDRHERAPLRPLLRPAGDLWEARFTEGGSTFLPRARGFEYLRVLLARPHVAVSALELRDLRCGSGAPVARSMAPA